MSVSPRGFDRSNPRAVHVGCSAAMGGRLGRSGAVKRRAAIAPTGSRQVVLPVCDGRAWPCEWLSSDPGLYPKLERRELVTASVPGGLEAAYSREIEPKKERQVTLLSKRGPYAPRRQPAPMIDYGQLERERAAAHAEEQRVAEEARANSIARKMAADPLTQLIARCAAIEERLDAQEAGQRELREMVQAVGRIARGEEF